jgi:hypothetical protein
VAALKSGVALRGGSPQRFIPIFFTVNTPAQSTPSAPRGIEHAGVIDAFMHDAKTDKVVLVMTESRPWTGDEAQLFQLQEKMNAYLSFALDGELTDTYPDLAGKPLKIVLETGTPPDSIALRFLEHVREQIAFQDIELAVHVVGAGGGCGPQCGCG